MIFWNDVPQLSLLSHTHFACRQSCTPRHLTKRRMCGYEKAPSRISLGWCIFFGIRTVLSRQNRRRRSKCPFDTCLAERRGVESLTSATRMQRAAKRIAVTHRLFPETVDFTVVSAHMPGARIIACINRHILDHVIPQFIIERGDPLTKWPSHHRMNEERSWQAVLKRRKYLANAEGCGGTRRSNRNHCFQNAERTRLRQPRYPG